MSKSIRILLIYTGGTIGMVRQYKSGALKAFDFRKVVEHIPELGQLDCSIDSVSFKQPVDSSEMNPGHWIAIATLIEKHYTTYDGFVVLHGSDTMSYSASALSFMLENLRKPVIFTGSQLPIGDLRTDAKENLITSIQLASMQEAGKPLIQEVGLYFEYKLYRANRTTKLNAEHFQAFGSMNYPAIAESGVHLKINRKSLFRSPPGKKFKVHKTLDTNVAILKIFPGMSKNLLTTILGIPELKALILETYGAGTAPTSPWILNALREAVSGGLHIVNVTQCPGGSVIMGRYKTSIALKKMHLIDGGDITTEAAITKLMYLLGSKVSAKAFKTIFETPLRGEMS